MPSGPTPDQIKKVQTNLVNMITLNDYVWSQGGQPNLLNAFLLLSEKDNNDPGCALGLNIFESIFRAIGAAVGPVGTFFASFMAGMITSWQSSPPGGLNTTFASLLKRIENTSIAVDTQLSTFKDNVAANWNVQFTYNGKTQALSDLAGIDVPALGDVDFEKLAKSAIFAMDQMVWQTVMVANYVITHWANSSPPIFDDPNNPPIEWEKEFIAGNPAYYLTCTWHNSAGCGDTSGWDLEQYNIGTGPGITDGSMSVAACAYLFIDGIDGDVINQTGLFTRKTVFNDLKIPTGDRVTGEPVSDKLSVGYLRAMKEGRTLGLLIEREGREQVEKRIIEKAHQDSVFAADLARCPRQTLEKFLDVKIPEVVSMNVIVENPRRFGLVIPMSTAAKN